MQIADRFHLHHNLLAAVKEALKHEIPNSIAITGEPETTLPKLDADKKTEQDPLSIAEQRRYEDINNIQTLLAKGYAPTLIKDMLHTTYNRIRRYATGDPLEFIPVYQ